MPIDRRQFLFGSSSALLAGLMAPRARAAMGAKNVVLVTCIGGWDAQQVFDPKDPDSPDLDMFKGKLAQAGTVPYWRFDTKDKVHSIEDFFDAWWQDAIIINGINVGALGHVAARTRILTGTADETAPDVAAIVAHRFGRDLALPYIDLGGAGRMGEVASISGRLGQRTQLQAMVDPGNNAEFLVTPEDAKYQAPLFVPEADHQAAIDRFVMGRASRQRNLAVGANEDRLTDFVQSYKRGAMLRDSPDVFMPAGTQGSLLNQVDAVPTLLRAGGGIAQSVLVDTGLPWDTHWDNFVQADMFIETFDALSHLMEGLAPILDDTLVVVLSEMGRCPKENVLYGKDHWPTTSAMILGAGLEGGRVLGGTDSMANPLAIDFDSGLPDDNGRVITVQDFSATVLEAAGVDAAEWVPEGTVFNALFG